MLSLPLSEPVLTNCGAGAPLSTAAEGWVGGEAKVVETELFPDAWGVFAGGVANGFGILAFTASSNVERPIDGVCAWDDASFSRTPSRGLHYRVRALNEFLQHPLGAHLRRTIDQPRC